MRSTAPLAAAVGEGVGASIAGQRVAARSADDDVVAGAAGQRIGATAAEQAAPAPPLILPVGLIALMP